MKAFSKNINRSQGNDRLHNQIICHVIFLSLKVMQNVKLFPVFNFSLMTKQTEKTTHFHPIFLSAAPPEGFYQNHRLPPFDSDF
jgi:hypothetical protein